jgi:amino acid adenylation domain-containing protein
MMTTLEFLALLKDRDIRLWAEGERLMFTAPAGALSAELRHQIAGRKADLLRLLTGLGGDETDKLAIVPAPPQEQPLLSFAQQRLWLLDQFSEGEPVYNVGIRIEWQGPLCSASLTRAFTEILRRHTVLRTSYPNHRGRPGLHVADEFVLPFTELDIGGLTERARAERLEREVLAAGRYPFRLHDELPLRITLVRTAEEAATLVLVIHHIACDAWSMGVLVGELTRLYSLCLSGELSPKVALPIQYSDFAYWQHERLQGELLKTQLAYWQAQLRNPPSPLALPTDRPFPSVQHYRGARALFAFDEALSADLDRFCRQHQTTMFAVLLALFSTLLHRYTGESDILIGTPVANRDYRELEDLIGFFVNTIVLRSRPAAEMGFEALLEQTHAALSEAMAHHELPFERMIEHLQTGRDLARSALFQVMFSYQNAPRQTAQINGVELAITEIDHLVSKFDLSITLGRVEGQLKGWVEYSTDLFDQATVERLISHYETLAQSVLADCTRELGALPLLPTKEYLRILHDFNPWGSAAPVGRLLHQLFEVQADERPEAIAVTCEGVTLTYADLETRSNQLAHCLIAQGVGPGVFVGVLLDRSECLVVALLAILKAGGAYVPLDPSYPRARLDYILKDTAAQVLLSEGLTGGVLAQAMARMVMVDDARMLSDYPSSRPQVRAAPSDLVYVIHTSGSSGHPKGVQISHANVVSFLLDSQRYFPIGPGDTLLAITTIAFDISVLEIFLPLLGGGCIAMGSRDLAVDGKRLRKTLEDAAVSYLQATPSTWKLLVKSGWESHPGITMLCGGEPLPARLAAQLAAGGGRLWNCYGPTETTVWSTYAQIQADAECIFIGRPLPSERVYVLDAHRQPVPIGVKGTLFIGGAGVSRGYLNRDELTAVRFVLDPFAELPGAMMYNTGDRVRFLTDGRLEYFGRSDFQVKLRGFRIELSEIEAVLQEQPEIAESVVVLAGTEDDQRILAYVVAGDGEPLPTDRLRERLKLRLPGYMVPSAFIYLERLPLTPNGKVDRLRLPVASGERPQLQAQFSAPVTATQRALASLWQDLLSVDRVGIHDNFFDLGGHSLLVVEGHSRITESFQRSFSVIELFRYTTIAELASFLDSESAATGMDSDAERGKRSDGRARLSRRRQRTTTTLADKNLVV